MLIASVVRRLRSRGTDGRMRHVAVSDINIGLGLIHAGVGSTRGVVSREWSVVWLLETSMHVLMVYTILTLVQGLFW